MSDRAGQILEDYIIAYREIFEKLYDDSGIWSLEYIIEVHRTDSRDLKNDILSHIEKRFSSDFLPFQTLPDGMRESVIFVRNRMIFIEYTIDQASLTRYISSLEISYQK